MDLLAVECQEREDSIIVRAIGDIDSSTVAELTTKMSLALQVSATHPARLIIIDLRAVTFFGSAGLNAVLDCHEDGGVAGTSVRLVADNAQVLRPIEVTSLDRVFEIHATVTDALSRDPDLHA